VEANLAQATGRALAEQERIVGGIDAPGTGANSCAWNS
jgi:hypothetical protein